MALNLYKKKKTLHNMWEKIQSNAWTGTMYYTLHTVVRKTLFPVKHPFCHMACVKLINHQQTPIVIESNSQPAGATGTPLPGPFIGLSGKNNIRLNS